MRSSAWVCAAFAVAFAACERDRPPPAAPPCWAGLAPGAHHIIWVQPSISSDLGAIQQRFARAVAAHQSSIQAELERLALPPGVTLPYDPSFGISEDEYRRLAVAYAHPTMHERGRFDLDVRVEAGSLRFKVSGSELAALDDVRIDRARGVTYRDLTLGPAKTIDKLGSRLGTWSGCVWDRDDSSDPRQLPRDVFELAIGRVVGSGRRFVHLNRARGDSGALADDVDLLAWIDD